MIQASHSAKFPTRYIKLIIQLLTLSLVLTWKGGGGREVEPCLREVGNLNRKYECKCYIFEYESFKGK